ncbi:hypothetical protein LJD69_13690, partial [Faecalibacillus faecis]
DKTQEAARNFREITVQMILRALAKCIPNDNSLSFPARQVFQRAKSIKTHTIMLTPFIRVCFLIKQMHKKGGAGMNPIDYDR